MRAADLFKVTAEDVAVVAADLQAATAELQEARARGKVNAAAYGELLDYIRSAERNLDVLRGMLQDGVRVSPAMLYAARQVRSNQARELRKLGYRPTTAQRRTRPGPTDAERATRLREMQLEMMRIELQHWDILHAN